jgi:hypothetical protein
LRGTDTLSRVMLASVLLILTAAFVASCGWRPGGLSLGGGLLGGGSSDTSSEASNESTSAMPAPVAASTRMSIAGSKPVDAYVLLGGRIKSCWFNADAPLLPNHVYRADVSPDGSKVQITIHQRQNLGRAGLSTYAIDFKQEGSYTVVTTENRKMTPELAAKMQFDIDRWKRGETNCSKEMPKVTAAAPAAASR